MSEPRLEHSDRESFLGLGIRVQGHLVLERCFDPTPAGQSPLAAGEEVGEGDYVLAETDPRGAWVRERVATSGSALAAVYALAVRHGLNPVFPPRVMADADALRARPGIDDSLLADLTGLPFCTIDGPATRDLDQALHVEALATGFRLHYALADASWFAPLGSALFAEALRRAASFYLPGLTIPMLPRVLSEGIVSLAPEVSRRALVMVLELDTDGQVVRCDWVRARVQSRAKLAFEQVARMLAGDAGAGPDAPELLASLSAFRDLGETLARRRDREGVVRYRRDEVDLTLVDGGRALVAVRPVVNPVERWNEEVSVLCNTQGARFLLEGDSADDAIEKLTGAPPSVASDDRAVRRQVIDGANRARALQSRLLKDVNRVAIDALFRTDLGLPAAERPRRRATVMGLRSNRLYCLLDAPPLEIQVYTADVAEAVGEPVAIDPDGIALRAGSDGRVLARLGDRVRLYVRGFDAQRDRWVFGLLAD